MSRQEKLPTDWDRVKLRKLVAIDKESLGAKTPPDYEFLYASLSDVNSGVINRDLPLIKFSDAPSRARRKVKKGDVLFSTVRPNLEGYARINGQVNNLIASTGFAVLSPKEITDTDFIYQYLYSYDIKRQIYALVVGSNYPAVNSSDVANLKFSIPKSTSERQAIAALLSTWDEAIEKTERLIQAKEKRFQLQLSEIISFIEEDNSAEFVELGKILSYEQPTKYIVESSDYVEYGKTPVLTANKSFILGHVNDKEGIYTELPVIIFDDFTTDSKFVDFSFKVKSSALKILKPASNVDAFLVYWLITRINTPVGGHKRHWISEYQFNEILLPKLSQQKKFSIILEYAQREINLLKQLADKYKTQKRGLMQKMLTGEWRVKPEIVNQYMEA